MDFTFAGKSDLKGFGTDLATQLPSVAADAAHGMRVRMRDTPHTADDHYLQLRVQFEGAIGGGTVKVDVSRENPIGPLRARSLSRVYPRYPRLRLRVYTVENIMSEELRSMVQRRRIRDYYDAWKLIRVGRLDWGTVQELFPKKCAFKGVRVSTIEDLFPRGLEEILAPYLRRGLTRLTKEELPPLGLLLSETKEAVESEMSDLLHSRRK